MKLHDHVQHFILQEVKLILLVKHNLLSLYQMVHIQSCSVYI